MALGDGSRGGAPSGGVGAASVPVLLGLAAAFLVALMLRAPSAPVIEADSGSYIAFAASRSAGYPLVLHLFGLRGTVMLQQAAAAAALAYLGIEMLRLCGSLIPAVILMAAVAVNIPLDSYHYAILSESLFSSLLAVTLGLLMRLCRTHSSGSAALASLAAGLAITVRPAGWFLLPLLVLAVPVLRARNGAGRRWLILLLILVAPLLGMVALERGASMMRSGADAGSTLMRQIYGKAGMIDAPATGNPAPEVVALEQAFAPVRALVARAPDFGVEAFFSLNYETCLEYACSDRLGVNPDSPAAHAAALARIAANPGGFLALAWRNYRALWTVAKMSFPAEEEALSRFVAANRPLPFESLMTVLTDKPVPFPFGRLLEPAVVAIGLFTAALAVLALAAAGMGRRLPPLLAFAGLAALAVHGGLALAALTGVGIPRYLLVLWPAMMAAPCCALWWGVVYVARRATAPLP